MRTPLMDQSRMNAPSYLQENQCQKGNNPLFFNLKLIPFRQMYSDYFMQ